MAASLVVAIVTIPELPWWPPGFTPLTEQQVRELFRYQGGRIGDEPIRTHRVTLRSLTDKRLGHFDSLSIVHMSARHGEDTVSVAIGIRPAEATRSYRASP